MIRAVYKNKIKTYSSVFDFIEGTKLSKSRIISLHFEEGIKIENGAFLFRNFSNLREIHFEKETFSECFSFHGMFANCSSFNQNLDFYCPKLRDFEDMFFDCSSMNSYVTFSGNPKVKRFPFRAFYNCNYSEDTLNDQKLKLLSSMDLQEDHTGLSMITFKNLSKRKMFNNL